MAGRHPFGVENLIPSRGSERLIVRPDGSLHLDGRRSKAMVESRTGSYSASNAYWDGVNWNRYDVAAAASAVWSDPVAGTLVLLTAAAGANPIAWTTSSITPAMVTQLAALAATYQPLDSDLTTIAGLTATTNNVIQSVSSAWASRTPAQLMATMGLQVPVSRLVYVANTNLANALAVSATTWTDIVPNQSYTVSSTASFLFVSVRIAVAIVNGATGNEFALRAVIDSAGTPANVPLAGAAALASGLASLGGGFFRDTGRAAGSHTIKIQVYGQAAFTAYCRASSNPNEEFAAMTIDEINP